MQRTHVYERLLNPDDPKSDSLSLIYSKIQPGSKVLDVGAGSGSLGKALKDNKHCVVHGLTYNDNELALLATRYDLAFKVDLESEPLPPSVQSGAYDVIVCGDVLEHLRNATEVLSALGLCLSTSGHIVVSVPNVSHLSVLTSLMAGRLPRTHEGLLDATHVHLFDRASFDMLCRGAGMEVIGTDAVRRHLLETEFSNIDYLALPKPVRQFLEQQPDADIYQHVWTLRPASVVHAPSLVAYPVRPLLDLTPRFEVRLYWDHGQGFSESLCTTGWGVFIDEILTLELGLDGLRQPVFAVRIDWPAMDGIFEFEGIEFLDVKGDIQSSWHGQWGAGVLMSGCVLLPDLGPNGLPWIYMRGPGACTQFSFGHPISLDTVRLRIGAPRRTRTRRECLQEFHDALKPELLNLNSDIQEFQVGHSRFMKEAEQRLITMSLDISLLLEKSLFQNRAASDNLDAINQLRKAMETIQSEQIRHIDSVFRGVLQKSDQSLEWLNYLVTNVPDRQDLNQMRVDSQKQWDDLAQQLNSLAMQMQGLSAQIKNMEINLRPWWKKILSRLKRNY